MSILFTIVQTAHSGSVKTFVAETLMTARASVWKRKREEFESRRATLFKSYERSPNGLGLALEIRRIDDQIAEWTQQIERENGKLEPARGV
jgi:hypothetical protein